MKNPVFLLYQSLHRWYAHNPRRKDPGFFALLATAFLLTLNLSTLIFLLAFVIFPDYEHLINHEPGLVLGVVILIGVGVWLRLSRKVSEQEIRNKRFDAPLLAYVWGSVLLAIWSGSLG